MRVRAIPASIFTTWSSTSAPIKIPVSTSGRSLSSAIRCKAGDVIADGPSTEMGELALGRNVVVALMPWGGYNFEDSILDQRTRGQRGYLYIDPHRRVRVRFARHEAWAPKKSPGIFRMSATRRSPISTRAASFASAPRSNRAIFWSARLPPRVKPNLSPEEKLLRAIFGEKAGEVRDTSLRVPPGVEGTVINVRIFSRKGLGKDERSQVNRGRRGYPAA